MGELGFKFGWDLLEWFGGEAQVEGGKELLFCGGVRGGFEELSTGVEAFAGAFGGVTADKAFENDAARHGLLPGGGGGEGGEDQSREGPAFSR